MTGTSTPTCNDPIHRMMDLSVAVMRKMNTPKGRVVDAITLVITGALDDGLSPEQIRAVIRDCAGKIDREELRDNRDGLLEDEVRLAALLRYFRPVPQPE
ncbi:MAG: hypothetical protein F8N36_14140 [Desulfovibrio sp.]|uniref:hypothetical protein n=1 Tax=Desulfovibrio sp. TaxID=885 RepID=UPI00135D263B|nr:hypothetical protein [Desulfovibrio sp.]MTJ93979.1 hypothetical protein [Desulfovibrio sp.]